MQHFAEEPSNFRAELGLDGYLAQHGVVGIAGIDTRRLTRHLRTAGAQMGVIATDGQREGAGRAGACAARDGGPGPRDPHLDRQAATSWTETGADAWSDAERPRGDAALPRRRLRLGAQARDAAAPRGAGLPGDGGARPRTTAAEALALAPDGVFLTNGPGDPAAVVGARETVAALLGKVPVFGICLGHQILALAVGAQTYKLKFGHRGANQPVKDLATGKVEITVQNHGFAVDDETLGKRARVTHLNLNDGTVEGIELLDAPAFSVQYHPEASPGPHDAR